MAKVAIEARVNRTEDPAKVEEAVRQVFPDARVSHEKGRVVAESRSLAMLMRKATEERIRDAARGALWRGRIDEKTTRVELSKQAAFVGRLNFNEVPHPLGDLVVTIETDDSLEHLLDEVAPPTRQEIAAREGRTMTATRRSSLHREESELEAIGSAIDTGWHELEEEEDDPLGDDEEA